MMPHKANLNLVIQCTTVGKLAKALQQTTSELIATRTSKPSLSVVALLARNLLELRVWTEFCTKSAENARKFQLDAVRDFDDIVKRVSPLIPADHNEALGAFKQFADVRTDLESVLEPGELDGSYQEIRKTAEEIGYLKKFAIGFKVLSKCAHPTALVIMMEKPSDERYTLIQDALIKSGLEVAAEALNISKTFSKGFEGTV